MNLPTPTDDPGQGPANRFVGRRRFLAGGAAVTPAVLTLASQPALANTCFTPSRSLSKNMSVSQTGKFGTCNGESPGNYKTQITPGTSAYNWPANPTPTTEFHALFSGRKFVVPVSPTQERSLTLLEVLNLRGNQDPSKVGFHMVGAYLNIVRGLVPEVVLSLTGLKTIWTEFDLRGYYEPVGGVKWYATDIVTYLQESRIAP
jgi:hypothetical protein